MFSLITGILGFVLYILYDINSFTKKNPFVHSFFLLGTVLIALATGLDLYHSLASGAFSGAVDTALAAGGIVSFLALIYCLFFALPFEKTYADQTIGNHVYDRGVYALCRHPGILCFFFLYLLLGLAALPGRLLHHGMVFSLLNLLYAWFQDRITFPKTFCDYREYRTRVPFLIPTPASIRMAIKTLPHSKNREEIL